MRNYAEMFGAKGLTLLLLRQAVWVACGFWIASSGACAPAPTPPSQPKVKSEATESIAERNDLAPAPAKTSADEAQNPSPAKPGAAAPRDSRHAADEPFDRLREIVLTDAVSRGPPEKSKSAAALAPAMNKLAARLQQSPSATTRCAEDNDSFTRLFAVTANGSPAPLPFMETGKLAPVPEFAPRSTPPAATASAPSPNLKAEPASAPVVPAVVAAPPKPAPAQSSQVAATDAPTPPVAVAAPAPTLAAGPGNAGDLSGPRQDTDRLLYLVLVQTFAILAVVVVGPLAFLFALCYVLRRRGSNLASLFNVEVINNTTIPGLPASSAGLAPTRPAAAKTALDAGGQPTTAHTFDVGATFEEHQAMLEEASHRQAEALHQMVLDQNVQLTEQLDEMEEEAGADVVANRADPHSHLWKQIGNLRRHVEEPGDNRDGTPFPSYVHEDEAEEGELEEAAEN